MPLFFGHLHGSPSQTNIQRGLRIAGILIFRCRAGSGRKILSIFGFANRFFVRTPKPVIPGVFRKVG